MNNENFDQMLEKYADVTVRVGLNLRKGQRLVIQALLDDTPFVRRVTESAYKAGARYVDVSFNDEKLARIRFEHADPESITEVPDWAIVRNEEYLKRGDAFLSIASSDPDLLNGINPELIAKNRKARAEKFEPLRKYENEYNWCVVSTASPSWAKKIFPDIPVEQAQAKLWEAIFSACRIDVADPVQAWKDHTDKLIQYRDYLNAKRYTSLHYTAPGTDLMVGLPENHFWEGGGSTFKNGIFGIPNLPTEEVFTTPHKDQVDGVVKASFPLNLQGVLIEDFSITFEKGKAVKVTAKKGEEDLRKLLETDENAGRLGECALVPNSSPIGQRGHLFYNTLFDENASCHLAFGNSYRESIQGGTEMTEEEFAAAGGNKSLIHVDFMIGSAEMNIDGICADGTREPVLRAGEWAFKV
ncbi:MAG: aminopeptidase [Anaerolineales bacterium]